MLTSRFVSSMRRDSIRTFFEPQFQLTRYAEEAIQSEVRRVKFEV